MEAEDLVIVISNSDSPVAPEKQGEQMARMLSLGLADFVHVRCPGNHTGANAMLSAIPEGLRTRVKVHRFPDLALRWGCGYHIADGETPPEGIPLLSRSCHTLEQAHSGWQNFQYSFLSPVFDSISKQGYEGKFSPLPSMKTSLPPRTVALGGVTPVRLLQVRKAGFAGGAMLGCIDWENPEQTLGRLMRGRRMARGFSLQLITDSSEPHRVAAQAHAALEGGCRWVQIRMKEAADEVVAESLRLCRENRHSDSIYIIDDRVELTLVLLEAGLADGVHLGQNDMPPAQAREILGPHAIIGCTANTPEQALKAAPYADYLGIGPWRYTTTKKNLAPVLGAAGVREITDALARAGYAIPCVAIGGLQVSDTPEVFSAGACGMALSGAINNADNPQKATFDFLRAINKELIR